MQTIKNIHYTIERVGNSTFCTMVGDLSYILSVLNPPTVVPTVSGSSFNIKITPSKEVKVFERNLANWGFSLEQPTITVVSKISLCKDDIDNQEIANRIVRDKARSTMNAVVMNALNMATASTADRLERIDDIWATMRNLTLKQYNLDKNVPE